MALTKTWTRVTQPGLVRPNLPQATMFGLQQVAAPSPHAVLLRTVLDLVISVYVPAAGSAPPADWWAAGYTEFRVAWQASGTTYIPPLNDDTDHFLGREVMEHIAYGDSAITHPYAVVIKSKQRIDTNVQRSSDGVNTALVTGWVYHQDRVSGLDGAYDVEVTLQSQMSVLWGT